MARRSRPQTRFELELSTPELDDLIRRYSWWRSVQSLGVYEESPLALVGFAAGLRGSGGLGVASNLDALVVGGPAHLTDLYRPRPITLLDAVAMALMANGKGGVIVGELKFDADPLSYVELLGEVVRLELAIVAVTEASQEHAIAAAEALGWRIEHLNRGDLLMGWQLGQMLCQDLSMRPMPVVVVLHGSEDGFDAAEFGTAALGSMPRYEREAVEAASRLTDDLRPEQARMVARRRLVSLVVQEDVATLAGFLRRVASELGRGTVFIAASVIDDLGMESDTSLIRLSDPAGLAATSARWGGFPVLVNAAHQRRSIDCGLTMTLDRDVRPGDGATFVESEEELHTFVEHLAGEESKALANRFIVGKQFRRDGFGRIEPGSGRWLRPVSELVVITWGRGVDVALHACAFLQDQGRSVGVLQLFQPGLIDEKILAQAVTARRIFVLYDKTPEPGYQLVTFLQEYFFASLSAPILLRSSKPGPGPIAVALQALLD